jgi:hypothetical protein
MNAARLFPRVGTALWRTPIDRLLSPATGAEQALAPEDVRSVGTLYSVPGWPPQKPFAGVWTSLPRPYPPGVLLIVAPIAALYHWTPLSFSWADHLLILLFLACAHFAFYQIARGAPAEGRTLYAGAAVVAYVYVTFWTLRGFYDPAVLVPLIVCGESIYRSNPLRACGAFAIALFVHFRALFYVPWALLAGWQLVEQRAWRSWSFRDWAFAAAGLVVAGVALYTLVLVAPAMDHLPLANPVHVGALRTSSVTAFAASIVLAGWLFARERAHLDIAMLVWFSVMIVAIRQLQAWHAFVFVPWVFAPAPSPSARFARIQWALVVTLAIIL